MGVVEWVAEVIGVARGRQWLFRDGRVGLRGGGVCRHGVGRGERGVGVYSR